MYWEYPTTYGTWNFDFSSLFLPYCGHLWVVEQSIWVSASIWGKPPPNPMQPLATFSNVLPHYFMSSISFRTVLKTQHDWFVLRGELGAQVWQQAITTFLQDRFFPKSLTHSWLNRLSSQLFSWFVLRRELSARVWQQVITTYLRARFFPKSHTYIRTHAAILRGISASLLLRAKQVLCSCWHLISPSWCLPL